MQAYQSRYEHAHSARALAKRIIIIGIFLCVIVFGTIYFTDYLEKQHIRITKDTFSVMETKQLYYFYDFDPKDSLIPAYTFEQGLTENGPIYEGIVYTVKNDVGDVLTNCFELNADGEVYKQIFNDCRDYFIEHDYAGATESIQTDDGRKKAYAFSISGVHFRLFFFENDKGQLQLMARKDA